eukprot:gene12269-biopygen10356
MLTRLNSTRRLRAGWLLALTYLFCIVAPAASFALADGPRAMHCLDADVTQVHSDDLPVTAHDMHMDAGMHDHAA